MVVRPCAWYILPTESPEQRILYNGLALRLLSASALSLFLLRGGFDLANRRGYTMASRVLVQPEIEVQHFDGKASVPAPPFSKMEDSTDSILSHEIIIFS